VLVLLAFLYVVPPLGMLGGMLLRRRLLTIAGATGYVAAVLGRGFTSWQTGGRVIDAPAHPISIGMLAYLTAQSWRAKRLGALSWKGRPIT
jgi:hypothetical protein